MTQHIVSTKTLLKSTIGASVSALIIFVVFILPAEYNIDPTHIGHKLGLTALAHTEANEKPLVKTTTSTTQSQQVIKVIVPAGRGVEYKFKMAQYEKMTYEWTSNGASLYFDLHGEPQGDTTGYFESYAIATSSKMKGSFTSPFAGLHGWYWKNNSDEPVVIQLTVAGQFEIIGLK